MKRSVLVCIGGLSLVAGVAFGGPGDGIRVGKLTLHPFLDVSGNYDSNVGLAGRSQSDPAAIDGDNQESDTFIDFRYGVNFDYDAEGMEFQGSISAYDKMYSDFNELDSDGVGQSLIYRRGSRESLELFLSQSFEDVQDYSLGGAANAATVNELGLGADRSDRQAREVFNVGVGLGRDVGEKLEIDGSYAYNGTDYENAGLFDQDTSSFGLSLGLVMSDKSSTYVEGTTSVEDSEAFADDANQDAIEVGLRSRGTDKLTYNVGLGYQTYDAELVGEEDIDEGSLSYSLGVDWQVSPKLSVGATGDNGYSAAAFAANNAKDVSTFGLNLAHQMSQALTVGAAYSYRVDEYLRPLVSPNGEVAEERTSHGVSVSLNYAPPGKWYNLYLNGGYDDSNSKIEGEDFDQLRAAAGVSVYY